MWRYILATLCVVAGLGLTVFLAFGWGIKLGVRETEKKVIEKGGAGLRGAEMLRRAHSILDDMLNPKGLEPPAYISGDTRAKIEQWVNNYNKSK